MAGICVNAEDPDTGVEIASGGIAAINTARIATVDRDGRAADYNESCHCQCTAQGILLRECEGETENLGNYGNVANCNKHLASHPKCNCSRFILCHRMGLFPC